MDLLKLIPNGYATKIAGALSILTSVGLFADWIGQQIGQDMMIDHATTWAEVVFTFSTGLAALGIRRAIDNK